MGSDSLFACVIGAAYANGATSAVRSSGMEELRCPCTLLDEAPRCRGKEAGVAGPKIIEASSSTLMVLGAGARENDENRSCASERIHTSP